MLKHPTQKLNKLVERFLNKALLAPNGSKEDGKVCSLGDVEEAKAVLRLVPIWTTCLVFAIAFAQIPTFFTKQGVTMDRSISPGFDLPAASLQSLISLSIVLFIPIYDRVFVSIARALTRKPSGITMLQRIGTGIFVSVVAMTVAALVEMKRLKTAEEHGLVDLPNVTIPMSVWWLIPQYVLFGVAEAFTMVGLQEFFYDQVPSDLRSVGLSLYLSIFGIGSFLSSFLISFIEKATGGDGRYSCEGVEVAERFAYYGISSNLITYLTGPLGQSTVTAAENVNIWSGTGSLLPLLGAFVADSFLGRYRTVLASKLNLCKNQPNYSAGIEIVVAKVQKFPTILHTGCALGHGGRKPCIQAFGADQFDRQDTEECKAKGSFFNWWYFFMCSGVLASQLILTYIQDNLSWSLGFGIPCILMICALIIFLLGSRTYRYSVKTEENTAFFRIGQVFVAAFRNWRITPSVIASEEEGHRTIPHQSYEQFKFLNNALLSTYDSKEDQKVCTLSEVEEAKTVLRLIPVWITCLGYAVVFAQSSTFFVKQASTMDRSISPSFELPSASLASFCSISRILFIAIYDRLFVPVARALTRKPSGITMLQRIGTGMFLSAVSIAVAALVEMKRLEIAQEYGLVNEPNVTVPMSVWWLVPSYVLFGVADAFTMVGLQELFYDQVPSDLRSVGLSLYLSILGAGKFLSSFLISAIERLTGGNGRYSWFDNNLNRAHLDYFYWILAALSAVQLVMYMYYAKSYIYSRGGRI
ncbi:unnamed protein product [Dovyalis caffra]|uniref:Uncharacterized protein n=1 Tax=Dovyalis caffra TaxID=77055 RepID=A0AAV1S1L8_9ROSI|nr:unnamed protein product [Dovyalis caffra]